MPEILIRREGDDVLTEAFEAALAEWFDDTDITAAYTLAGAHIVSAVRWPGAATWRRLVDEHVIPVSERLYRAGAAVVDGSALESFLDGVRDRLVEQSTLIDDIKAAQQTYGDAAADLDWAGAEGDALPWRSRSALIGGHEAQVTSMQSATDSNPGARKRWRARDDSRTRATHHDADGQAVGLDEPFRVGSSELMYPGDPRGPAGEILNCRCEMYLITREVAAVKAAVPDGAEALRRYWTSGEGAAQIGWGTPGDFDRCVRLVDEHMPGRAEGYCAERHHDALGIWPAQHKSSAQPEDTMPASLTAAVSADLEAPLAPRDTAWDGADAKKKLAAWATDGEEVDEDKLARGYLWRTDGPPSDWKLPVATIIDDTLTLVWDGITAAAGAVQGARSPIDLPAGDVDKVKTALGKLYAKAAGDFDDDSIEAPWLRETEASLAIAAVLRSVPDSAGVIVASLGGVVAELEAGRMSRQRRQVMASALSTAIDAAQQYDVDTEGPWTPPAAWFSPPDGSQDELISPEGRVSGYVAPWEDTDGSQMCHAGYAAEGECAPVPRGGSYDYFHQGNVALELDDGTKIHPGLLTTDIGHGPATPNVDAQIAHYDNPQAIAAAVIVGEDDHGVWMSGAVLPQVMKDPDKFTRLRLTPVSGHWSETQVGGAMELIAVTSVNKPGYPQRSTSGYALAASIAAAIKGDQVGDLQAFRAQLAEMLATVDVILESGDPDDDPDGPPDEMAASAAGDEVPDAEIVEAPSSADEITAGMVAALAFTEDVDRDLARELVASALKLGPEVEKLPAKDLKAAALPGIDLPKCLQILSDFLEGTGTESGRARAASVKAAEAICRSTQVKNAAVRARACRLVSEYRVKAGVR